MAKKSKAKARKRWPAKDLMPGDAKHVKGFADVKGGRKAGEGQKDFMKITMKEVFITSVNPTGSTSPQ